MVVGLFLVGLPVSHGVAAAGRLPVSAVVQYFPGDYYTKHAHQAVARMVLLRWPGPQELARRWRSGPRDERQRLGILLGGTAFHDPVLLPVYREALADPDPLIREAAAFGFRSLIAAPLPDVRADIDDAAAKRLNREIAGIQETLRSRSLVRYWLDRLEERETENGSRAVRGAALRALDVLLRPEDLPELAAGYLAMKDKLDRYALLPLLQAMTCRRFIFKPAGPRAGWGPGIYEVAADELETWLAAQNDLSPSAVLTINLAAYGMAGVDPMGSEACPVWLEVLRRGQPFQWPLAARQLYRCGGLPVGMSMLSRSTKQLRARREAILRWYGLDRGRRDRKQLR